MANISEDEGWTEGIYQLEQDDLVIGGADGIDNLQAKQLAARTNYLKALAEGLGTNKQPIDAMLTALAALVASADKTLYFTGPDAPSLTPLTAFIRTLMAAADAAAAIAVLGAAPLDSPALTGNPTAPTPLTADNDTSIATTEFVHAVVAALVNSSPATLDTLNELATALGDDPNFAATMATALGLKAPLSSPAFTDVPTAPTAAPGTNTTQLSTTAFVQAAVAAISMIGYAQLAVAQTYSAAQSGAYVPLVDGATITPNFAQGNKFRVQLGGNRTMANPTNAVAGTEFEIDTYQDSVGSRTLSFAWMWQTSGGTARTLTATARAKDKIVGNVDVYSQSVVTISIAAPGVVSWTAHGLMAGQQVQMTTTGALPTGLAANTTYFVVPIDADHFSLAATQSGAAINTTGAQAGVHTMTAGAITYNIAKGIA
ncbi:MAG: hypothetical protein Q7U97_03530 [Rhodocyclaceae bacterium]|nr:hypothetical protein [Rhodocyclaceae bacterium]